ncbi:uncharacterized protein ACLA_078080 [Aspergillus clavatus NRRL 1]|uniref:Uncharacterized protein n=1 Tax=Aspergillus clavatus (strain ATCC 1007 / CBS 513.65 / DSM 816 / NCTC 3887 / NRRL 1 / QM 1276 / 107) TaxID=344612 RepID=A1CLT1_ASPCL|nr:uncharacterized protein ACLA_078080 [Aspergillus clavatus NRRL 1]EAW09060.1 conserved hypothetical protein [Aspergillus clavatus NRRL 1]
MVNTNTNPSANHSSRSSRSRSSSSSSSNLPPSDPPPPYTPSETTTTTTTTTTSKHSSTPRSYSASGSASSTYSALTHGLQVPSRADYFTSGFVYPPVLRDFAITPTHWTQFTHELATHVKLSRGQWVTTVAKALGALALGGTMLGVLGAVPAVLVGRKARRNREEMNLVIAAAEPVAEVEVERDGDEDVLGKGERKAGALARTVQRWNETFFRPRGLRVRVEVPWEGLEEMDEMEVSGRERRGRKEEGVREDAARKARIVIVPVDS